MVQLMMEYILLCIGILLPCFGTPCLIVWTVEPQWLSDTGEEGVLNGRDN